MEKKKWDVVLIVHILIILWALIFFSSLFLSDSGKMAGTLAPGNIAGIIYQYSSGSHLPRSKCEEAF